VETRTELITTIAARAQSARPDEYSFADVYEVCAFLQHEIQAARLKYTEIARRASCAPSTVSNLASGETKQPRAQTMIGILVALGFEVIARR
jgi:predicted XRE-type DNA-binding protein